jgi:MFS family permease
MALRKRLLPLYAGTALQGFMLWVPVEKLFMNEIGFDAANVGIMAAAYSAFVPLVEVPSGLLADRWSRRGVLAIAGVAISLTALVGGLSNSVLSYIGSALVLGVYFAMYSGTMEAIVYDTVREELGDGEEFERRIGHVRAVESAMLVTSSLAGGWIAGLASPRLTYFLTVPFGLLAAVAFLRFREPSLHKGEEPVSVGSQLATTYRALAGSRALVPVVALAVLVAVTAQTIFEFGPLWLVSLAVPAVVFGPYWAALVSSLGFGGLVAGRLGLDRRRVVGLTVAVMLASGVALTLAVPFWVVVVAQVVLATLLAAASIHVTRLVHDAVPSAVRSGVASGIGALTWIAFLPVALLTGWVTETFGTATTGWLLVALTAAAGLLWIHQPRRAVATEPAAEPEPEPIRLKVAA